jgi:hypothetical protein
VSARRLQRYREQELADKRDAIAGIAAQVQRGLRAHAYTPQGLDVPSLFRTYVRRGKGETCSSGGQTDGSANSVATTLLCVQLHCVTSTSAYD